MSKFASQEKSAPRSPAGPVLTDPSQPTITYEGGAAHGLESKSALFTLAATNMVGEDTFYESARARDERFRQLVAEVTLADPEWVARFVPYLRGELNMRSAAVVVACEYAATIMATRNAWDQATARADRYPSIRSVIASACLRADEPAEVLGYWWSRHGRTLPKGVKRGIADAAVRLYNERSALRYDGKGRGIRMSDVVDLTHPKPASEWQSDLFHWLLDRRHNRPHLLSPRLSTIDAYETLQAVATDDRRGMLDRGELTSETLDRADMSWESFSGWLQGPMDAKAWETVAPTMGLMAITRNLRNFDEAGMSDDAAEMLGYRFNDPDEVRKSRMFPFRFWTAYREAPSKRWAWPLERGLRHSCANVPRLSGRTLVMVDVSGSMDGTLSRESTVTRWEVAGVFAAAMSQACDGVDVVPFATYSTKLAVSPASDVLTVVEFITDVAASERLDHGTRIWTAMADNWSAHDRVVVFTDDQARDSYRDVLDNVPFIYTFDLGGYGRSGMDTRRPGRYRLAGFSDAAFRLMDVIERGKRADWPF